MLIFVSSIGRGGTRYLSELFSHVSLIKGNHIPEPQCTGKVLADYNNFIPNKTLKLKRKKIKNSIVDGNYFESSQLFLRCFVDEIIELSKLNNYSLGVIHLLRDPLECAKSYTNRKSEPGKDIWRWRPHMNFKKNYLKIEEKGLTLYQKNLWDWFENEIRYYHYKDKFDKVYDYNFSFHNNYNKLIEMFNFFNVKIDKEKLRSSIQEKNLPRGENPTPSIVSNSDIKEAKEFLYLLKGKGLEKIFSNKCYKNFRIFNYIEY